MLERSLLAAAAGAVALVTASCADANLRSRAPAQALPQYAGHAAALFDDDIEPRRSATR
jgi:hypothetical protein